MTNLVELQSRADSLRSAGRLSEAVDAYVELSRLDPRWGHGWVYLVLGEIHEELGNIEIADSYFSKSVQYSSDPPNSAYRLNYGSFVLQRGQVEKALRLYWEALEVAVGQDLRELVPKILALIRKAGTTSSLSSAEIEGKIEAITRDAAPHG